MAVRLRPGRLLLALLLLAAVMLSPWPSAAADPDPDPEEQKVLAELFTLGRSLEETRAGLAALDVEIKSVTAKVGEAEAERDRLTARRDRQMEIYRKRIRFYHEYGAIAPYTVLIGASSLMDFFSRLELLQEILRRDRDLLRELKSLKAAIEAKEQELRASAGQLAELRAKLQADEARLQEDIARREAVLAGLRERRAAVESELARLERVWNQQALPVLEALGTSLMAADVSQFTPDSVRMSLLPPGATVLITEQTLNRFFAGKPELKGLTFKLQAGEAGLHGEFEGTKVSISGGFTLASKTALRYGITSVKIGEFQVPEAALGKLADSSHFDIDVGTMVNPFSLTDVKVEDGRLQIKAGLR